MKVLVVVDAQVDFCTGALANPEAVKTVPKIIEKIEEERKNGTTIIYTKDHHDKNYLNTLEGKKLPIPHCIEGTEGIEFAEGIQPIYTRGELVILKSSFGSFELINLIKEYERSNEEIEVEIVGFVTSICVASNAIMLRSAFPNMKISVDANCCADISEERHYAGLLTMQSCLIDVNIKEEK